MPHSGIVTIDNPPCPQDSMSQQYQGLWVFGKDNIDSLDPIGAQVLFVESGYLGGKVSIS
jgi:hypothetical protein